MREYMMTIQTNNSTETTRNSRVYDCCFGMEEYQNHNLTGKRRKSGKICTQKYLKLRMMR
jgi:hypothetical protein